MHPGLPRALDDSATLLRFVMAISPLQRPEPRKDSNLKRKGLTVSPRGGLVYSRARVLAPHTGHVSNLCGLKRRPFELLKSLVDQWHPHKTAVLIQTGRPVWTRLELARGTQDS